MRVIGGYLSIWVLILAPDLISSWNSSSAIGEEKTVCVCDGDCELIEEQDCPWGLTLDICGCCLLCSRGEGEPCGGAVGTCAEGLFCLNHPRKVHEGVCIRSNQGKVCPSPVKRFGCLFQNGNCVCETQIICEGIEIFLFDNEESCRSRIAILAAREDHLTLPTPSTNQATENCRKDTCPKGDKCPLDSYRLPSIRQDNDCCPVVQKCQCNPGLRCPLPECPSGWVQTVVANATGLPGGCCAVVECEPAARMCSPEDEYNVVQTWTHLGDCMECMCTNGIRNCNRIHCDCSLTRTPAACCPPCIAEWP